MEEQKAPTAFKAYTKNAMESFLFRRIVMLRKEIAQEDSATKKNI